MSILPVSPLFKRAKEQAGVRGRRRDKERESQMRKIRMFGLLAVTAMGLAAFMGTSSASAAAFTAGGAGEPFINELVEDHVFNLTGSTVECDTVDFPGTTTGTSAPAVTVNLEYDACEAFGFAEAAIDENGCEVSLMAATTGEPGQANIELHGCDNKTAGVQITVNVPFFATCTVDVPEQTIGAAARYTNTNPGGEIDVAAQEIMVDVTTSTIFCPLTTGTHSGEEGGSYMGASRLDTLKGVHYSP
jgi:hypothetical protein